MNTKNLLLTAYMLIFSLPCFSQWVNDPSMNTLLGGGSQLECPMIVADPSGNSYVSFWKLVNGFYNMHLQKIDVNGYPLWGPDGIEISNQDTTQTFTTYYDLGIDRDGNTILIIEDSRKFDVEVYAYKVDADGNMLWGPHGRQLSNGPAFDLLPKLLVMQDNSVVFTWITEDSAGIRMQRLSPDGTELWGPGIFIYHQPGDPLPFFSYPTPVKCDDKSFFLIYEKADASFFSTSQALCIQRYDLSGQAMWPAEVPFQNVGGFPPILLMKAIPDLQHGCIISWLDARVNPVQLLGYVQRVDKNGNVLLPQNGVLTLMSNNLSYYEITSLTDPLGNIYSFLSSDSIMTGQKVSPTGQRLWGNQGINYYMTPNPFIQISQLDAVKVGSYNLATFAYGSFTSTIIAILTDESGNTVWPSVSVDVANGASFKMRSSPTQFCANQVVVAWEDNRNAGMSNIYAQNIFPDGNIGPLVIPEGGQDEMLIYPCPAREQLQLSLEDVEKGPVWVELYQANGQLVYNKIFSETRNITMDVSRIKQGVYHLIITTKGRVVTKKVVIM
jgi:hypothetical protein